MNIRFKTRIAIFNTIAAAILSAVVFLVVYGVVHSTTYRQMDSGLVKESGEVTGNLRWQNDSIIIDDVPEWKEREHTQTELNPTFLQIADIKGRVLFRSTNLGDLSLPDMSGIQQDHYFSALLAGQHIRIGVFPIRNGNDKKIGTVTVAISEEGAYSVLKNLRSVFIVSFLVSLLILYFATSLAASKSIRPVNRLIETASGIDDTNIDTRLPLPSNKDELYQLATTINDLLNRIENKMLQQKRFTSDASHELRTPLAAIRGTLEVMIRRPREPEYHQAKIREVIMQVDRMEHLISQLLLMTRLGSGTTVIRKETLHLHSFLVQLKEGCVSMLTNAEASIKINVAGDAEVITDPNFLEIILDNLVNNAVKYGKKKGLIEFSWDEDSKCLSVSDDGPGISEEHIPHLFEPFYRADLSRNSRIEGTGLGLAIVKRMAELQNIRISIISKPGEGTRFELFFP